LVTRRAVRLAAGANQLFHRTRKETFMSNVSIHSSSLTLRTLAAAGLLVAIALPQVALAQDATACGSAVKSEVAKTLDAAALQGSAALLKAEAAVYEKYKSCGPADAIKVPTTDPIYVAARQCGARVSYLGSIFYEEMSCCGYDPQRRTFACPVKVKQTFGFGGAPLPGSREYVLNCVADAAGVFRPVGDDSVHLADSVFAPTWQFAVVANAVNNLNLVQPMNGAPRRARSILSWNLRPTGCDYQPIWGNALDYNIRLDQ
jgi:hypothetical protein